MKNILIIIFLIFVSKAFAQEASDVYLLHKGHNEVVARLKSKTDKEVTFIALENTTSEIEIILEVEPQAIKKFPEKYQAKFCFDIAEDCNWSCKGKFVGYLESVMPWKKLKLEDMIDKVQSCDKTK